MPKDPVRQLPGLGTPIIPAVKSEFYQIYTQSCLIQMKAMRLQWKYERGNAPLGSPKETGQHPGSVGRTSLMDPST